MICEARGEMAGQTRAALPRTAAVLAVWIFAVSMIISRLGLVLHELVGHGVAAVIAGGRVSEVELYVFGGGWISYGGAARWSVAAVIAVSLAGIAVELMIAVALAAIVARRRTDDRIAIALVPVERADARRTIAARHPGRRLAPPLGAALALAAAIGLFTAPARRPRVISGRTAGGVIAIAIASVILVVAIDVVAAAWC